MEYLRDVRDEDFIVLISDWKEQITDMFENSNKYNLYDTIWEMSIQAFDKPREVQVVIDANSNVFISVGSPGFVTFGGQDEQVIGMKFPVKEWIHTHPFGKAYFSGTDMNTIFMYQNHMEKATVLGDGERSEYLFKVEKGNDRVEYITYVRKDNEEEL